MHRYQDNYKGGYGVHGHFKHIKVFKKEQAWATGFGLLII